MPALMPAIKHAERTHPAEEHSTEVLLRQVQVKQQIVQQLIDGHLNLLEAAARFRKCQGQSLLPTAGRDMPAGDAESVCRTVIGWVDLALAHRPEQAEAVTDRLERELLDHLNRDGQVQLPTMS